MKVNICRRSIIKFLPTQRYSLWRPLPVSERNVNGVEGVGEYGGKVTEHVFHGETRFPLWASDLWDRPTLPLSPYKWKGQKESNQKTEQVNVIPFQNSVRDFGNTEQKAAAGDVWGICKIRRVTLWHRTFPHWQDWQEPGSTRVNCIFSVCFVELLCNLIEIQFFFSFFFPQDLISWDTIYILEFPCLGNSCPNLRQRYGTIIMI